MMFDDIFCQILCFSKQVEGVAEWPIEAGPEFVHGGNALLKVRFTMFSVHGDLRCCSGLPGVRLPAWRRASAILTT